MKLRRLRAAVLTAIMALSLTVPALAAGDPTLKVTGTTQVPTINVQLPTEAAVVLNPYKLKVTIGTLKDSTDQIVSPVIGLTNLSDCPIQLGVKVNVKMGGNAALAASISGSETVPTVKLDLKGIKGDKAGAAISGSPATLAITTAESDTDLSGDFKFDGTSDGKAANTLAAATNGKAATTGGVFNLQFSGQTNNNSGATWTAKDIVTPTLTFKFIPVAEVPAT